MRRPEPFCERRVQRPPSVHRFLGGKRIEQRDGVFASVVSEMTVVDVDHRDARAHEAGDGKDRDAGSESKGRVRVTEVVGLVRGVHAGSDQSWFPGAEVAQVDVVASRPREEHLAFPSAREAA